MMMANHVSVALFDICYSAAGLISKTAEKRTREPWLSKKKVGYPCILAFGRDTSVNPEHVFNFLVLSAPFVLAFSPSNFSTEKGASSSNESPRCISTKRKLVNPGRVPEEFFGALEHGARTPLVKKKKTSSLLYRRLPDIVPLASALDLCTESSPCSYLSELGRCTATDQIPCSPFTVY